MLGLSRGSTSAVSRLSIVGPPLPLDFHAEPGGTGRDAALALADQGGRQVPVRAADLDRHRLRLALTTGLDHDHG